MVSLDILLWVFIIIFAIIGSMRGWAKELLVTFSILLAMFSLTLFEAYLPFFKTTVEQARPATVFWLKSGVLITLVFFGYQTPKIPKLAESGRFMRNQFQDTLLGTALGGANGYLLFGSIWYFLHAGDYPFPFVLPPDALTQAGQTALTWIEKLPPAWLMTAPTIYIAIAVCFVFVLVVFI